jgi:hypothetical protein
MPITKGTKMSCAQRKAKITAKIANTVVARLRISMGGFTVIGSAGQLSVGEVS